MTPATGSPARRLFGVGFPVAVVLTLSLALTACGGDPRSVASFCAMLRKEGGLLTDTSDPAALAERYA